MAHARSPAAVPGTAPALRLATALALPAAALLLAHGTAHAQPQPAGAAPLLAPQNPCTACTGPLAQAGATTTPAQGLPATPPPADDGAFRLADVRFTGAGALDAAELRAIAQPYLGRAVTLAELETLAAAITARYRERGFFLAQAIVPVQQVQDGVVEISVIEGRLGRVAVEVAPDAPVSEARVRGFLAALEPGRAVAAPDYERAMLLLSDQPGLRVGSALQEGQQGGTTDLAVEVAAAPRWAFAAEADNHGTRESGRYRAGGTVRWNSPLGIGDNLDARLLLSNGNALQFGRLAYEAPLGTQGLRAGLGLARVHYELGGAFAPLGAQGTADVVDLSLNYPVIRQRQHNLFLRLDADSKNLTDEFRAVDHTAKKRVQGVGLGWAWERRDAALGGGYWASAGRLYRGDLSIRDAATRDFDAGPAGRRTEGGFTKLTFTLSRLQAVVPQHALFASLGGQWGDRNLDPSEKLALGGARAVRAYASGEVLADQGLVGTLEWRWTASGELTPFAFYDAARARLVRDPTPFDTGAPHRSLRGAGVGVSWSRPGSFSVNATLAWRQGTAPGTTDGGPRSPRLYVHAQKAF